jgi:hypothetical protein
MTIATMDHRSFAFSARICVCLLLLCESLTHARESTRAVCSEEDGTCVEKDAATDTATEEIFNVDSSHGDAAGEDESQCGIYFAKSTIPGAGLGMFAGKSFKKDDLLLPTGDVVLPVVDIVLHNGKDEDWHFLWDEYTWDSVSLLMDHEGSREVNVASPGFGAAANAFLDLTNVEEWTPLHGYAGLARDKDPGAGAISPYHGRLSTAKQDIRAGQELFVNYGNNWFHTRLESIGPVPIKGDVPKANLLLQKWHRLFKKYEPLGKGQVLKDMWESFAWTNPFNDTSRELFALPKNWEETALTGNSSLTALRTFQSMRSADWLEEFGACADNLNVGTSTIPHAGRGAFSRRKLSKGNLVAPFPLIHLTNRKRLHMYKIESNIRGEKVVNDRRHPIHHQLMLNYCMGHRESTILLCPYGIHTMLINHSQKPNVKLVWAATTRSNHHPDWLNLTVPELEKFEAEAAGLAMEAIALRDIQVGEEIFLDYGDEWQDAWDNHLAEWKPVEGDYVSAETLNADNTTRLKTEFEQMIDPYPGNVFLKCNDEFGKGTKWKNHYKEGTLKEYVKEADGYMVPCELLRYVEQDDGGILYTALFRDPDQRRDALPKKLKDVPREAFGFFDRPCTSDMHLPSAFRHDLRIPDALLPDKWRNLKESDGA